MRKEAELKFKHLLNVEIETMHSLAYEVLEIKEKYKDRLGSLRAIDLYVYLSEKEKEFHSFYATSLLKLLRTFCNTSLDLKTFLTQALKNPKDYEINPKLDLDYLQKKTLFLWQEIQKQDCSLAYEHDFYLKAYQLSRATLKYDYILVDEAQDINGCVIDIVLNQKVKKVFIGDTYQSIYKFRGAINSLELLAKKPKTHTLYLTQSFRCPLSIAEIANDYLKLLNAPKDFQGTLKTSISKNKKQKTFITRTNAKLFDKAVENLNQKLFLVGGVSGYNFDELLDLQYLLFKRQEFIKNAFIAKFKDLKELLSYALCGTYKS